mmetsp:Transcript_25989/g.54306  ORF Transcript_25989/g.54306 Transcript_25989/m.54306 type:complete len:99 (-) Transcript_25989:134-430(-)
MDKAASTSSPVLQRRSPQSFLTMLLVTASVPEVQIGVSMFPPFPSIPANGTGTPTGKKNNATLSTDINPAVRSWRGIPLSAIVNMEAVPASDSKGTIG